eukprot:TRINITY_DN18926_c0_g1_i1.p2 TRINITY_DN18926_c0_g1~~TRINITY_DN18926_c0_g1_i1.p2  ORF type:complete len:117 (+),score=30.03 TRINITY_DN18926_c0_g1_i1:183-533(+)
MGATASRSSGAHATMALSKAQAIVDSNPVAIFSKTYCPYCTRVKKLFSQLGAKAKVIELDTEEDGDELQNALAKLTGQRTVPNVFIGGKSIGGSDSTSALHSQGKLVPQLQAVKAL